MAGPDSEAWLEVAWPCAAAYETDGAMRCAGAAPLTMYLYRSNRTETLVAALCQVVCVPAPRPLEPETVVVQSRGMQRWLSLRLAERLGIWSNSRFPFPRAFIETALDAVLEEPREPRLAFTRDRLTWAVAAVLPDLLDRPGFAAVADYLRADTGGTELVELSRRVAHVFDQYVVYRPDLVMGWEAGQGEDWQAELWRTLVRRQGSHHLAARVARFRDRWRSADAASLPSRVCVFGVSALPPLFVNVLAVLSERCPVHLFLLGPSREYWAFVRSSRSLARQGGGARFSADMDALFPAEIHPLLAAWGRVARDMQDVLESSVDYMESGRSLYTDPGTDCMLHALQSDLLDLRRPGYATEPHVVRRDDLSISVHACHGPMRQVQALRDQLVAAFDADATLKPHDVLVMVPDIDLYAPLIDDVFGARSNEPGAMPYRIADRMRRSRSDGSDALMSLLRVLRGRLTASAVLALLDHEPLLSRFGIEIGAVPTIRHHVQGAGIRWGVDAADRERAGQPHSDQNTWRFGLRRLLLGYAMPGEQRSLFAGVLPYDDIEGDAAVALGQFAELCEELFVWRERLRAPRRVCDWVVDLRELMGRMLGSEGHGGPACVGPAEALEALASACSLSGFEQPVELDTVERELVEWLSRDRHGHDFVTGGVTFCAMLPMRSIPCRLVCLVGMDDGVFPRTDPALAFDLVANKPRVGDRSLREEDRALVLEALLSARDRLIITYTGREPQNNSIRQPSIVVSELLGALDEGFVLEPAGPVAARPEPVSAYAVVVHPLQAHSPRYFGADSNPKLFSYSGVDCEVARAFFEQARDSRPFFSRLLPVPPKRPGAVDIQRLVRFFDLPVRFLFEERLGLYLGEGPEPVRDREPLELDDLERYRLGTDLLERSLDDESTEQSLVALRAAGVLPPGNAGRYTALTVSSEARSLADLALRWQSHERLAPRPFELEFRDVRLVGVLDSLWPEARVTAAYGRVRARHKLRAWIHHLVLSILAHQGDPAQSVLIGRAEQSRDREQSAAFLFGELPRSEASELLERLVSLSGLGLRGPLAFFPESSLAFCEEERRLRGEPDAASRALDKVHERFLGGGHVSRARAEGDDPYVRRAFGEDDPLTAVYRPLCDEAGVGLPSFTEVSRCVFCPMLDRMEVIRP